MKNKRFLVLGLSSALLLTGCNSVSSEEASNTSSVNTSECTSSEVVNYKEVAMRTMAAKSKQSAAAAENLVKTENNIRIFLLLDTELVFGLKEHQLF